MDSTGLTGNGQQVLLDQDNKKMLSEFSEKKNIILCFKSPQSFVCLVTSSDISKSKVQHSFSRAFLLHNAYM